MRSITFTNLLSIIRKLIKSIGLFSLEFGKIPKCDLLIFHDEGEITKLLENAICVGGDITCQRVNPYGVRIHLGSFTLFKSMISNSIRNDVPLREVYLRYLLAEINLCNPKGCLTRIDDCRVFSDLAKKCPEKPFIAIQNGTRPIASVQYYRKISLKFNYLFCFGKDVLDRYNQEGIAVDHGISSGPLLSGLYADARPAVVNCKFKLGFVGQWGGKGDKKQRPEVVEAVEVVLRLLARYLEINSLSGQFAVFGRNLNSKEERNYYDQFFGNGYVFVPSARTIGDYLGIYRAIDACEVTLAYNSTAAFEMLPFKKKILFCDPFFDSYLSHVTDGVWIYRGKSYKEFARAINRLFDMTNREFWRSGQKHFNYLCELNFDNLPQHKLREKIQSLLLTKLRR